MTSRCGPSPSNSGTRSVDLAVSSTTCQCSGLPIRSARLPSRNAALDVNQVRHVEAGQPGLLAGRCFGGERRRGGRGVEQIPRSLKINGYVYQRHGTGIGPGDPPWAHRRPPDSVEQMRRWRG